MPTDPRPPSLVLDESGVVAADLSGWHYDFVKEQLREEFAYVLTSLLFGYGVFLADLGSDGGDTALAVQQRPDQQTDLV